MDPWPTCLKEVPIGIDRKVWELIDRDECNLAVLKLFWNKNYLLGKLFPNKEEKKRKDLSYIINEIYIEYFYGDIYNWEIRKFYFLDFFSFLYDYTYKYKGLEK